MKVAVLNQSTLVCDADAAKMTAVIASQAALHIAPAHDIATPAIEFFNDPKAVPKDSAVVVLIDSPDVDGALGYHEEVDGQVVGKVFVKPVFDNGGSAFGDPSHPEALAVSAVLSHEVAELLCDRYVNLYADGPEIDQGSQYAYESADPVQDRSYEMPGTGVMVSDFVTPQWFDPEHTTGRVDFLDALDGKPFTLTDGGYMVVRGPSGAQQVFGEKMPEWQRELKRASFRFANRQQRIQ